MGLKRHRLICSDLKKKIAHILQMQLHNTKLLYVNSNFCDVCSARPIDKSAFLFFITWNSDSIYGYIRMLNVLDISFHMSSLKSSITMGSNLLRNKSFIQRKPRIRLGWKGAHSFLMPQYRAQSPRPFLSNQRIMSCLIDENHKRVNWSLSDSVVSIVPADGLVV